MIDSELAYLREFHLTVRALCIAIAAMESVPKEYRATSDMEDWEAMLDRMVLGDNMREFYSEGAWRTLAALSSPRVDAAGARFAHAGRLEGERAEQESPPDAATSEGQCKAVEANAGSGYATGGQAGNSEVPPGSALAHPARARESRTEARERKRGFRQPRAAFQAPDGRIWRYSGKRACVLIMLVEHDHGITQWDTLPWHTRLGGTVHAMRRDGLDISTELEGEYRHARYRLRIRGRLLLQPESSEGAVPSHRQAP